LRKKLDPRVIRTRKLLREALMSLVQEKPFERITVTDITKRATLNRATFYAHYLDKYDLLDKCLQEWFENDILAGQPFPSSMSARYIQEGFVRILEHYATNADFYRLILSKYRGPAFSDRFHDYFDHVGAEALRAQQPDGARCLVPLATVARYQTAAELGVIAKWLSEGMPESVEELAKQLTLMKILGIHGVLGIDPAPDLRDLLKTTATKR